MMERTLDQPLNQNQTYNQNININRNNNGNRGRYRFPSCFRRFRFEKSVFPHALAGNRAQYPSRKPDQGGRKARFSCQRSRVSLPVKVVDAERLIGRINNGGPVVLREPVDRQQQRPMALEEGKKA